MMKQKNNPKSKKIRLILCAVLCAALLIPVFMAAVTHNAALAKSGGIQYKNAVFTKKLYKSTKKMTLESGTLTRAKDKDRLKSAYALLAGMKLKAVSEKPEADAGTDTYRLSIYRTDGKKKVYTFEGNVMSTGKKIYVITKSNPFPKLCSIFSGENSSGDSASAMALATAKYPEMTAYPGENGDNYDSWSRQRRERQDAAGLLDEKISGFYQKTTAEILKNAGDSNRLYSPVNVYMALAMLTETTDGDSRRQLLDLLQSEDTGALRTQAKNLWTANYRNDGATTSILANSLWLNEDMDFQQGTVDLLADDYLASVFCGDPASAEMSGALQNWLNEQTGGLLSEAAKNTMLSPDTVMELCSTVYYRAKWDTEFDEKNNDRKTFHSPAGDTETEFMNISGMTDTYYRGENYGAVCLDFAEGGCMWLILPDEDSSIDRILTAGEYLGMTKNRYDWENKKAYVLNISVPKFDVSSDIMLKDSLTALGVTDIFESAKSDFTPLAGGSGHGLSVNDVRHAVRVQIDEEGCTAAAFTEIPVDGAGYLPESEELDFIADRPFLFVITGDTGQPLFIGTVNQP